MPKPRRTSDATLVRRSQQGDRRAFSALLGRYDWRLRGLAHALLLDRAEMDVALATGYLRAWRDVVRVDAKEDVAAWLYRVTYNACIDQLRRADNAAPSASDASDAGPASGAGEAAASTGSGIAAGLATLPAAERVAVVLVDREGFSPGSAARILGMAESALSVTLDSARERLTPHIPEPAEAPGNGSHPHDPPVETPARANGVNGAPDGDGDATAASPDDEDAAPSPSVEDVEVLENVEDVEVLDGDEPGAGNDGVTATDRPDPAAATATDRDEAPSDDITTGTRGPSAAIKGNGATADRNGGGATDNGATGNGNGTGNGRTEANGSRSADRNRGKGRRSRRRAQHAAGQPQAEGPATPRDDAT